MKIVFFTYSTSDNSRLKYRAIECGWFDNVIYHSNCSESCVSLISNELSKLSEGDILVYANEFSEINLNGYEVFSRRLSILGKYSIILYENDRLLSTLMYIKKDSFSVAFFKDYNVIQMKNNKEVYMIKPSLKCIQACQFKHGYEFRLSDEDIIPDCKRHIYSPFSMFVVGHVLPYYEANYDIYTHFINVGSTDLHRCNANSKINIKERQDLAELTALYWLWKNINVSDLKYIGFSTYRKPFLMTNDKMYEILSKQIADCIACKYHANFYKIHLAELGANYVSEFKAIVKGILDDNEYKEFIDDYENGKFIYICNSFVIGANKLNELCERVFRIMLPVSDKMNGKHGQKDHRPCAGCFAEAVTSFYLKKIFGKIYPSPFLIYPLYNEYLNNNIVAASPLIFGTFMQDEHEIFYPLGEHPKCTPTETPPTSGFYSENDVMTRYPKVIQTKGYLVK